MSAAPKPAGEQKKPGGKKKLLILVAALLLLVGIGAGGWFSGVIPKLLGRSPAAEQTEASAESEHGAAKLEHGAAKPEHGDAHGEKGHGGTEKADTPKGSPLFMDLPDIVANLNTGPRRATFVKLKVKLELAKADDQAALTAAMPRILDLFQGYLREMRPEELRGTAGTYRLREELLARMNLAAPPARVVAVLFTEIIVQ